MSASLVRLIDPGEVAARQTKARDDYRSRLQDRIDAARERGEKPSQADLAALETLDVVDAARWWPQAHPEPR